MFQGKPAPILSLFEPSFKLMALEFAGPVSARQTPTENASPGQSNVSVAQSWTRNPYFRPHTFVVRPELRANESSSQKVHLDSLQSLLDPSIAPHSVFCFVLAQFERLLYH